MPEKVEFVREDYELKTLNRDKKKDYTSYKRGYVRRERLIYGLAFLLLVVATALTYFLSGGNLSFSLAALIVSIIFIALIFLMQKNDDAYISAIVEDLSRMLDSLAELNSEEVFPCDEDSLISKLQTQVLGLVSVLRKQNEKEVGEHENIKALVSDLSHQLKTPIANLKMYTDFLKQQDLSEAERNEYISILENSVERLLFLSEGMIKLSRLESGLIHVEKKKQSINDTILCAIKDSFAKAKNKGVNIEYCPEFEGEIDHDRKWTAEAIFNLIDNAIKYGVEGSTVYVGIRKLGTSVEIFVEDENVPISPAEYNSVFKRFFRGSNSKKIEGAGIGLYLTSDIVEKQGGFASLKKGKNGNRFTITMFI